MAAVVAGPTFSVHTVQRNGESTPRWVGSKRPLCGSACGVSSRRASSRINWHGTKSKRGGSAVTTHPVIMALGCKRVRQENTVAQEKKESSLNPNAFQWKKVWQIYVSSTLSGRSRKALWGRAYGTLGLKFSLHCSILCMGTSMQTRTYEGKLLSRILKRNL